MIDDDVAQEPIVDAQPMADLTDADESERLREPLAMLERSQSEHIRDRIYEMMR